jgi:hypothetical protein
MNVNVSCVCLWVSVLCGFLCCVGLCAVGLCAVLCDGGESTNIHPFAGARFDDQTAG